MGEFSAPSPSDRPWIGVDLDGTLAKDGKWVDLQHIGQPVEPMMKRVREWTAQGIIVKIFTARAGEPNGIPPVKAWLKEQGLPNLDVTNEKDFNMIALWDDRAIQVIANTGIPVLNRSSVAPEKAPPTSNPNPNPNPNPNLNPNPDPNPDLNPNLNRDRDRDLDRKEEGTNRASQRYAGQEAHSEAPPAPSRSRSDPISDS